MDDKLRELAEYYGIEISNTPGAKIIDKNGAERLTTVDDIEEIFGELKKGQLENKIKYINSITGKISK